MAQDARSRVGTTPKGRWPRIVRQRPACGSWRPSGSRSRTSPNRPFQNPSMAESACVPAVWDRGGGSGVGGRHPGIGRRGTGGGRVIDLASGWRAVAEHPGCGCRGSPPHVSAANPGTPACSYGRPPANAPAPARQRARARPPTRPRPPANATAPACHQPDRDRCCTERKHPPLQGWNHRAPPICAPTRYPDVTLGLTEIESGTPAVGLTAGRLSTNVAPCTAPLPCSDCWPFRGPRWSPFIATWGAVRRSLMPTRWRRSPIMVWLAADHRRTTRDATTTTGDMTRPVAAR